MPGIPLPLSFLQLRLCPIGTHGRHHVRQHQLDGHVLVVATCLIAGAQLLHVRPPLPGTMMIVIHGRRRQSQLQHTCNFRQQFHDSLTFRQSLLECLRPKLSQFRVAEGEQNGLGRSLLARIWRTVNQRPLYSSARQLRIRIGDSAPVEKAITGGVFILDDHIHPAIVIVIYFHGAVFGPMQMQTTIALPVVQLHGT